MISFLNGTIIDSDEQTITIDVKGVGYQVYVPMNIPSNIDEAISIHIFTHMKESTLELYGFKNKQEKRLFQILIKISGIGPKTALATLNIASPEQIFEALEEKNISFFTQVPGIGKRTAGKLIIELQEKFTEDDFKSLSNETQSEAHDALISLGYTPMEARHALKNVKAETPEAQIKEALKNLAQS